LPRAKHPILISHHPDRYLLLASSPDFVWAQLVELKNGETFNGHLVSCDNFMNVILREVFQTSADGDRFWKMKECYVREIPLVHPVDLSLSLALSALLVRLPGARAEVYVRRKGSRMRREGWKRCGEVRIG
jgi:hypothetical protein